MAKGKSTWKYNKLLTARRNYFAFGASDRNNPMGIDFTSNAYHGYRGNADATAGFVKSANANGAGIDTNNLPGSLGGGAIKGPNIFQSAGSDIKGFFINPGAALSSPTMGITSMLGAAAGAVGQIGGQLLSNGLESKAGGIVSGVGDALGAIPIVGGFAKGALNLIGGGVNALFGSKLNQENIAAVEGATARANSATSSATNFDTLSSTMGSAADVANFSDKFIGRDGVFSSKAKKKAAALREEARVANERQALALLSNAEDIEADTLRNLEANYAAFGGPMDFGGGAIDYDFMNQYLGIKELAALGKDASLGSLPNSFADGGGIHIKKANRGKFTEYCGGKVTSECIARGKRSPSPAVRKRATFAANARKWKHAFGGDLLTHGANFDTGVTIVGNGGTHEENPYEGVPMGVDNEGTPNLVEQGEVIFNDYVFSNRLNVPKDVRKRYKLRGAKPITFADAAVQMSKESEERPNDPISQNGLKALMSNLAYEQEVLKQETQSNQYARGGKINKFDGKSMPSQRLNTYKNYKQLGKDTDFYTPEYLQFWDYMGNPDNIEEANAWLSRINSGEFGEVGGNTFNLADIQRLSRDYKQGPVHNAYAQAAKKYNIGRQRDKLLSNIPQVEDENIFIPEPDNKVESVENTPINTENETIDVTNTNSTRLYPTWMRYVPAFMSGAMALTDALGLTNKPDYSDADAVLDAARNAGTYTPIGFNPIGNYLGYTPFDREFYINQMNAQAGATRRAIGQNAGLNRGAGMAALLASDYNAQGQLGQLARQAEEYNLAQRQKVEEFNRATDMFNTEGTLKADMTNQEARLKARDTYLKGTLSAAELRQRERQQSAAARSANLSNFINSIGDIGRENFAMNQINTNKALLYGITGRGESPYKGRTASKGGYLTRKKRRK